MVNFRPIDAKQVRGYSRIFVLICQGILAAHLAAGLSSRKFPLAFYKISCYTKSSYYYLIYPHSLYIQSSPRMRSAAPYRNRRSILFRRRPWDRSGLGVVKNAHSKMGQFSPVALLRDLNKMVEIQFQILTVTLTKGKDHAQENCIDRYFGRDRRPGDLGF